jgi:hypothetical protein
MRNCSDDLDYPKENIMPQQARMTKLPWYLLGLHGDAKESNEGRHMRSELLARGLVVGV